ncbi:MAG TPA: hypothetical protein PLV52_04350, partial [Candidatus Omnitrophota bacterium]|nr:hypothetical protein [Candidatus Omnitrophota bacterium]
SAVTVFDGDTNIYTKPSIALDSSNYVFVTSIYNSGTALADNLQVYFNKSTYSGGDITTWSDTIGESVGRASSQIKDAIIMPQGGSNMCLIVNGESQNIVSYTYDGTLWSSANAGGDMSWFRFPGNSFAQINAIAVLGGDIYLGGYFNIVLEGEDSIQNIAMWDGSSWNALGSGINGTVWDLEASGEYLYVAGQFSNVDGISGLNNLAKWDGAEWSAVVPESISSSINKIAIAGDNIYVGGWFSNDSSMGDASGVAWWNGSAWNNMGGGVTSGGVSTLAVIDNAGTIEVYVGGSFTQVGGTLSVNSVAHWNSEDGWSALGTGVSGGSVNAIAITDITHIYFGGYFASAGGVSDTANIAMWDGEDDWSSVGGGVNGSVNTMIVDGTDLYVGGYFYNAGMVNVNYIARWDGSDWEALDGGVSSATLASNVRDIAISGTDLYVAGSFTSVGSPATDAAYVALCDLSETPDPVWSAIGDLGGLRADFGNTIFSVAVLDSMVYVGGIFSTSGDGSPYSYLARWDGSVWEAFGSPDGSVRVIEPKPGSSILYIGGYFQSIGGISAKRIVECDLTDPENPDWSALGDGLTGSGGAVSVDAIEFSGTDIYVGGQFDTAGTVTAYNVAVWDGADWDCLGTGGGALSSGDRVNAIGISGTDVYIGGYFTDIACEGSVTASHLVIWDSSDGKWYQVSSDQLTSEVYVIDVLDSTHIYVGGNFWSSDEEGYLALSRIARWDGSDWYDLEGGLDGQVFAINAVSTSEIYIGGDFMSTADGYIALAKIAKLDDSGASAQWTALGNGLGWSGGYSWSDGVKSIAVDGSDIYV